MAHGQSTNKPYVLTKITAPRAGETNWMPTLQTERDPDCRIVMRLGRVRSKTKCRKTWPIKPEWKNHDDQSRGKEA
jgi:hypothetical protein